MSAPHRRDYSLVSGEFIAAEASLPVRSDGGLRVAVVADTHSQPHPNALRWIAEAAPDAILHAGDIGDLAVLEPLRALAPLLAVRGNIDVRRADLPDVLALTVRSRSDTALIELLLLHIGVNGPKVRADAAREAKRYGSRLVVCGHSHVPFIGRDRGLSLFNPGSMGPRRFSLPIVFGIMELTAGRLELWHVDCETGQRWLPP